MERLRSGSDSKSGLCSAAVLHSFDHDSLILNAMSCSCLTVLTGGFRDSSLLGGLCLTWSCRGTRWLAAFLYSCFSALVLVCVVGGYVNLIIRIVLFSCVSKFLTWQLFSHTGAQYSAVAYTRAREDVLVHCAVTPQDVAVSF